MVCLVPRMIAKVNYLKYKALIVYILFHFLSEKQGVLCQPQRQIDND